MENSKTSTFTLKASYLEVYNEKVQDLLELSSSRDSLVVRWSADRGFYVEDLFCVTCENVDDLMAVLEEGNRIREISQDASYGNFVETQLKFAIAKLSIRKLGGVSYTICRNYTKLF